jgi:hypothetical protein
MDEMPDRRRVARVIIPWHLSARVLDSHDVRILDLSTAGVGIEHVEPLQPGASCTLEFPLPFGSLRLTARVVWSLLKGGGQIREGDRGLHYQSGLAFTELTPEQQTALARALETLQATRDVPDPETPR